MKTKLCIELKDQDELNSLTEILSFYLDRNNGVAILPNVLAADLLEELGKFKRIRKVQESI